MAATPAQSEPNAGLNGRHVATGGRDHPLGTLARQDLAAHSTDATTFSVPAAPTIDTQLRDTIATTGALQNAALGLTGT